MTREVCPEVDHSREVPTWRNSFAIHKQWHTGWARYRLVAYQEHR